MIIAAKIDVTKILKSELFTGKKGVYLDIVLIENRNGTDQYGNDFVVVQNLSKEKRDSGEKGPILGNAKRLESRQRQAPAARPAARPAAKPEPQGDPDYQDDVPF